MAGAVYRVALIGCGRMGQEYLKAYAAYPDTEVVALVDPNPERLRAVASRFGVRAAYRDVASMLRAEAPDVAAVVAPTRYLRDAVIACAEGRVRGVSTEKPMAAILADADAMVDSCARRGVVFAGGNLQRAMNEVQEAARRLREGRYGPLVGASVHAFGGEISGGGCQHISVLRLLADAEVEEVRCWGGPPEALAGSTDEGLVIHGLFRLTSGLECPVFGTATATRGVDAWTTDALIRWDWGPPEIYQGYAGDGTRRRREPGYAWYPWSEFGYLTGSIRSFLAAVAGDGQPWISGHDLRQALEVAIACRLSAQRHSAPVRLPLEDRSLALYPVPYRWLGGDSTGNPQPLAEAEGR